MNMPLHHACKLLQRVRMKLCWALYWGINMGILVRVIPGSGRELWMVNGECSTRSELLAIFYCPLTIDYCCSNWRLSLNLLSESLISLAITIHSGFNIHWPFSKLKRYTFTEDDFDPEDSSLMMISLVASFSIMPAGIAKLRRASSAIFCAANVLKKNYDWCPIQEIKPLRKYWSVLAGLPASRRSGNDVDADLLSWLVSRCDIAGLTWNQVQATQQACEPSDHPISLGTF